MRRSARLCCAVVGLLAICAGCGLSGASRQAGSQRSDTTVQGRPVRVVAIGDSDATGIGDESSRGWVGRYGDLLTARLGTAVAVDNEAAEGQTTDQLLSDLARDPALRQALAGADVVLIGIGGADLNAGDEALNTGSCRGRGCYTDILRRFDANILAIASDVRQLAPRALMRAMSLPNAFPGAGSAVPSFATADISRYQARSERASVCRAMRSSGGRCVDVVAAFNGPRGDGDAYVQGLMTKDPCCYPSAKGQQLIAQLLIAQGLKGLPQTS